ncbi:hypothetical protein L484_004081 [Morus notabilis]|uniref:Uncharacterized protein n=1 Tax=Morus notabilis TaxID=981085 RepID=W9R481_9ROSA|nr:hypothetical protein L484_004081 [Morus notabilis]
MEDMVVVLSFGPEIGEYLDTWSSFPLEWLVEMCPVWRGPGVRGISGQEQANSVGLGPVRELGAYQAKIRPTVSASGRPV